MEHRLKHCSHFILPAQIRDKLLYTFDFYSHLCGELPAFPCQEFCSVFYSRTFHSQGCECLDGI